VYLHGLNSNNFVVVGVIVVVVVVVVIVCVFVVGQLELHVVWEYGT
jgi:hypothetical protein